LKNKLKRTFLPGVFLLCGAGMSMLLDLEIFSDSVQEDLASLGVYAFAIRADFCQWCYSSQNAFLILTGCCGAEHRLK